MFEQTVARALSRLDLDRRGPDAHPRQPAPMLLQRADKMFASPCHASHVINDAGMALSYPLPDNSSEVAAAGRDDAWSRR